MMYVYFCSSYRTDIFMSIYNILGDFMYDRKKVYEYAKKWAYSRNPKFYNYDSIGGDCTNFVSQCIFAGCNQMNYMKENGWYYINGNDKSPSWTGVQFLYNFLITNIWSGPKGERSDIDKLEVGDVIQLSFDGTKFTHSTVIVQNGSSIYDTLIAAHTYDVFEKAVADYGAQKYRFIHVSC